MSFIPKFPKIASWCLQECPLCHENKIVIAQGIVRQEKGVQVFPDRGYSFCNCKNIFFTEWTNIDKRNRHSNESKEVMQYYLKDMGFVHRDVSNNFLIELVYIKNQGIGKNRVHIVGNAPDTRDEFSRFGFLPSDMPADLIWSYHTVEHEEKPLETLKHYYEMLNSGGILFVAMPDPYFIDFNNMYTWEHWLLREHHIMWDMDSFCDEAIALGFKVVYKTRNTAIKICKDMHIILSK